MKVKLPKVIIKGGIIGLLSGISVVIFLVISEKFDILFRINLFLCGIPFNISSPLVVFGDSLYNYAFSLITILYYAVFGLCVGWLIQARLKYKKIAIIFLLILVVSLQILNAVRLNYLFKHISVGSLLD